MSGGFGKATLLAAWREVEAARKPVVWLTVDEGDRDPVVLWSYVIEALRRVRPGVGQSVPAEMTGAAPVADVVLPRLVNELADHEEITLILDDFHRFAGGDAVQSVAWFIDHSPSTLQLVLSTRTEPALPGFHLIGGMVAGPAPGRVVTGSGPRARESGDR